MENVARDRRKSRELRLAGWRVLVIWECEVRRQSFSRLLGQLRRSSRSTIRNGLTKDRKRCNQ
jgi:G:T-mismatch repair DNA endonuclease (very short patch repair protein)